MKYPDLNLGQIEAIVNKLGGMDGVRRFLQGDQTVVKGGTVKIDRNSHPFTSFPEYDNLVILEQDHRAIELERMDSLKISLEIFSKHWRDCWFEDRRAHLDAKIHEIMWNHKDLIPESWKKVPRVNFDGTIFRWRHPSDYMYRPRSVLAIRWDGKEWIRCHSFINNNGWLDDPSAVIEQC